MTTGTSYVILQEATEADAPVRAWTLADVAVLASSSRSAVRKYLEGLPAERRDGAYVAIPTRSFVPVTVKRREVIDLT